MDRGIVEGDPRRSGKGWILMARGNRSALSLLIADVVDSLLGSESIMERSDYGLAPGERCGLNGEGGSDDNGRK